MANKTLFASLKSLLPRADAAERSRRPSLPVCARSMRFAESAGD